MADPFSRYLRANLEADTAPAPPPGVEPVPPPQSMPGYCVAVPLDEEHSGLSSALVVEMAWAEAENSASYVHSIPFGVGARILFAASGWSAPARIDGYLIVPVSGVVAWTPGPEGLAP